MVVLEIGLALPVCTSLFLSFFFLRQSFRRSNRIVYFLAERWRPTLHILSATTLGGHIEFIPSKHWGYRHWGYRYGGNRGGYKYRIPNYISIVKFLYVLKSKTHRRLVVLLPKEGFGMLYRHCKDSLEGIKLIKDR